MILNLNLMLKLKERGRKKLPCLTLCTLKFYVYVIRPTSNNTVIYNTVTATKLGIYVPSDRMMIIMRSHVLHRLI